MAWRRSNKTVLCVCGAAVQLEWPVTLTCSSGYCSPTCSCSVSTLVVSLTARKSAVLPDRSFIGHYHTQSLTASVSVRACVLLSTLLLFVFHNSVLCVLGWCWLLLKDVPKTVHFLHSILMHTKWMIFHHCRFERREFVIDLVLCTVFMHLLPLPRKLRFRHCLSVCLSVC